MGAVLALFHQPPSPGHDHAAPPAQTAGSLPLAAPPATATAAAPRSFTNVLAVDWRAVESDDYRKYVANLRAVGCPEATIRDIIVADVNKLFEARERELMVSTNKFQFWKREHPAMDEKQFEQARALVREKRALLRELLGVEVPEKEVAASSLSTSRREQILECLPKEKREQVNEAYEAYTVKAQALMAGKARPTKADLEQLRALESEASQQVARMLTPEQKEELDLRVSRTANSMRATLGEFDMTEGEFKRVYALRKDFDERYAYTSHEDPERVAAQLELDRQVRSALGDDRYTHYLREQNWSTSTLRNVAQEHNIPKETAVQVFDLKAPAQEQAVGIRQEASLTPQQRQQMLQGVQDATVRAIAQIIGQEAVQAYAREGSWIRALSREK
jgi:hypothetical protein